MAKYVFEYARPERLAVTRPLLRETLAEVRDMLLNHGINGGPRKLAMNVVCQRREDHKCGTAACIGGWVSIFLLGFDAGTDVVQNSIVESLFSFLTDDLDKSGRLRNLFYDYCNVKDFDEPNVAATAIQRYLDGKAPWPESKDGDYAAVMPNVLPYKRTAKKKAR